VEERQSERPHSAPGLRTVGGMARPRRPTKRRAGGGSRRTRLDTEGVLGALAGSARGGVPAARLLRALGGDRHELRSLQRALRRLEREGRVERVRGGWRIPRRDGLVEAEVFEAEVTGAGRARDDAGREHRLLELAGAHPGDRVLIAPARGDRPALALQVVGGARDRWVGILRRHGKLLGIAPYRDDGDWWLRVARGDAGGAAEGDVVAAVPATRGGRRQRAPDAAPWVRVVERLGRPGEPDADFAAVVWRHRLPTVFPDEVLAQVDALPASGTDERAGRLDLRDRPFVTIDPASARDRDDAVCVEAVGGAQGGFRLWVAIADVAHWVAPGSPVDREALRRGNSVYFPDRAIPMLPERLSGDVCSLRPDVDRLVMVVELAFDERGETRRTRFHPGVIRSRARLTYEQAADAMERGDERVPEAPMLRDLARLARILGRRRRAAGSLDFELPSPSFSLDERGYPTDVRPAARSEAHRAIEEAMLAANRAVAEWLVQREVEAVHRIHEPPAPADRARLVTELTAAGLLDGGSLDELSPRDLARALERAVGRPGERWIHQLALRSMRRARYSARSQPHFALAFEHYLHFTSPIRRYADLAVHRALKAAIAGEAPALRRARAETIAVRASFRERIALEAEREMDRIKACVLARDHLGERHGGTITGLAPHGLYVTLDAWWLEGLVHVSRLGGFFELDPNGRTLRSRTDRYELGDRVQVAIAAADPVTARIDFELEERRRGRRGSA